METVELLAPAGSMDGLKAAIAFGADAVYLGGRKHNARIGATNFGEEGLANAIKYAGLKGVKSYITLNTVVFDDEINGIVPHVNMLQDMGASAVIIQDFGVAKKVAKECTIPMHASTQMGIHNTDGCYAIEELGFSRAILSRETPLKEIELMSKSANIELEAFVHGALCACFSGQCYYSFLKGGRSGNRGECAQPCRLDYKGYGHILSTKDLMALELIPKLIKSGVKSFKIEGRMKRPAYAGIVTKIYRQAIDLALEKRDIPVEKYREELIKIYNRGGFTKGYFDYKGDVFGNERPNHLGEEIGFVKNVGKTRTTVFVNKEIHAFDGLSFGRTGMEISDLYKNGERIFAGKGEVSFSCVLKDIKAGDKVYRTTDTEQIKEVEEKVASDGAKIPLEIVCNVENKVELVLRAMDKEVSLVGDFAVEQAKTRETTKQDIEKSLCKLGDTPFVKDKVFVSVSGGVFIPVKELNGFRRKAVALLEKAIVGRSERARTVIEEHRRKSEFGEKSIGISIHPKKRPKDLDLYLVYADGSNKTGEEVDGYVLNPIAFEEDLEWVDALITPNTLLVCNNIGQIHRYRGKCRIWAGPGMNCTNKESRDMLFAMGCEEVICSVEAKVENTLSISGGLAPVMHFVECPKKVAVGCGRCTKEHLGGVGTFDCIKMKNTYAFLLNKLPDRLGNIKYL